MSNYPDDDPGTSYTSPADYRARDSAMSRCKCGRLFSLRIPSKCACGDFKSYWKTLDGRVMKLSEMTLGHLNNSIRMLGEAAEKAPPGEREEFEIALDMLYAELGSRDKEIAQATGIMAALTRSIQKGESDER